MYSPFRLAIKYIRYYLTAASGKGHGIHSPFVFDFIEKVLQDGTPYPEYEPIEVLRKKLEHDNRQIPVTDFGAGSATGSNPSRSVAAITRHAAKSRRLGRLLFRVVRHYRYHTQVELGTSLGFSAAYIASANPGASLVTLEGAPAVADIARDNLRQLAVDNAEVVTGNFDVALVPALSRLGKIDFAFIDGNHRKEATLRYFRLLISNVQPPALLIFDDIHWSADMEDAWGDIKKHEAVMLTVDLFFLGLVFFNTNFKIKQHFVIRF